MSEIEQPSTDTMLDMMRIAGATVVWTLENEGRAMVFLTVVAPSGARIRYKKATKYDNFVTEQYYQDELHQLIRNAYYDYIVGKWDTSMPRYKATERILPTIGV